MRIPLLLCAVVFTAASAGAQVPPVQCKDSNGNPCGSGGGSGPAPIHPLPGQSDEQERQRQAEEARKIKEKLEAAKKKAAKEAELRHDKEIADAKKRLQDGARDAQRAKEDSDALNRRQRTSVEMAGLYEQARRTEKRIRKHDDPNVRKNGIPVALRIGVTTVQKPDGTVEVIPPGSDAVVAQPGCIFKTAPGARIVIVLPNGEKILLKPGSVTAVEGDETRPERVLRIWEGGIHVLHEAWHGRNAEEAPLKLKSVRVEAGMMVLKGTDFVVHVDAAGSGSVGLIEGKLEITEAQTGRVIQLTGPQGIDFTPSRYGAPRALTAAESSSKIE